MLHLRNKGIGCLILIDDEKKCIFFFKLVVEPVKFFYSDLKSSLKVIW